MNDYHLYEEIGRGKHSVVYKVFSTNQYALPSFTSLVSMCLIIGQKKEHNSVLCHQGGGKMQKESGFARGWHVISCNVPPISLLILQVRILHSLNHPSVLKFQAW